AGPEARLAQLKFRVSSHCPAVQSGLQGPRYLFQWRSWLLLLHPCASREEKTGEKSEKSGHAIRRVPEGRVSPARTCRRSGSGSWRRPSTSSRREAGNGMEDHRWTV